MVVDPNRFGINDFAFPLGSGGGGTCDYPPIADVKSGISYDFGAMVGTYGAANPPQIIHSPGDILRWCLIDLAILSVPNSGGNWEGFADYEPATPDDCVTVYNTQGVDDGREMNQGSLYSHHGIQIRVRSTTSPAGWAMAEWIRKNLAESIRITKVSIDGVDYLIQAMAKIGQVIPLGREVPTAKGRFLFTINCTMSRRKV